MKAAPFSTTRGRLLASVAFVFSLAVLYPAVGLADTPVPASGFGSVNVTAQYPSLAGLSSAQASPAAPAGVAINRPVVSASRYASLKAEAAAAPKTPKVSGPQPLSTTSIAAQYAGPNQCGPAGELCWYPPDSNASASEASPFSSQAVSITNSKITVFDKASGTLLLDKKLSTLMGYTTQALFDPRIEYDQTYHRWFATAEGFQESSSVQRIFLAVSSNSDATGGWCVFNANVTFASGDFFDYIQMGNQQDSLVFTGNIFPAAGGYAGADMFGWSKAKLVNCTGFNYVFFSGLPGTTTPSNVIDGNPRMHLLTQPFPPASSVINVTYKNPGNIGYSSATTASIPIAAYGLPPQAPQAGSSIKIDTSDGRFSNNQTQYGNELWATHTTNDFGFATPRFYDFRTEGGSANTVIQTGDFFQSNVSYDWNPSIAAHQEGRVYLNWSNDDGTSSFPRMSVGGRVATDAAGAHSGVLAFTSPGPITQNGNPSRWGDTSSVRFETLTGTLGLAFNETAQATGQWASRFVRFSVS
jgi:hypothetical protein